MLHFHSVPSTSGAPSFRCKRPSKEAELEEQLTTKHHSSDGRDDSDAVAEEAAAYATAATQSVIQQHGAASCQLQPGTLEQPAQRQTVQTVQASRNVD